MQAASAVVSCTWGIPGSAAVVCSTDCVPVAVAVACNSDSIPVEEEVEEAEAVLDTYTAMILAYVHIQDSLHVSWDPQTLLVQT